MRLQSTVLFIGIIAAVSPLPAGAARTGAAPHAAMTVRTAAPAVQRSTGGALRTGSARPAATAAPSPTTYEPRLSRAVRFEVGAGERRFSTERSSGDRGRRGLLPVYAPVFGDAAVPTDATLPHRPDETQNEDLPLSALASPLLPPAQIGPPLLPPPAQQSFDGRYYPVVRYIPGPRIIFLGPRPRPAKGYRPLRVINGWSAENEN